MFVAVFVATGVGVCVAVFVDVTVLRRGPPCGLLPP
jgi:hypothetical protein